MHALYNTYDLKQGAEHIAPLLANCKQGLKRCRDTLLSASYHSPGRHHTACAHATSRCGLGISKQARSASSMRACKVAPEPLSLWATAHAQQSWNTSSGARCSDMALLAHLLAQPLLLGGRQPTLAAPLLTPCSTSDSAGKQVPKWSLSSRHGGNTVQEESCWRQQYLRRGVVVGVLLVSATCKGALHALVHTQAHTPAHTHTHARACSFTCMHAHVHML